VSTVRVLRTASAVLTREVYAGEDLVDAAAGMMVTVTRLDGTVVSGPVVADHPGTGRYTYTLPGQPDLDTLNVAWTGTVGGSIVTLTDRVEIVGGFFFELAEARGSDSSLSDPLRYPTAALADKRLEVEVECERICGWAFVPRHGRIILPGIGGNVLTLPIQRLRAIRSISTTIQPGVAALVRYDGGVFPLGTANIVVEFEHGWDYPPEDLKEKSMYRLRSLLNLTRSGVPDRVSSYSTPDGAVYRITLPTRGSTGIPEVDAVYSRHEAPPLGFA
jgi:hypothetical protein